MGYLTCGLKGVCGYLNGRLWAVASIEAQRHCESIEVHGFRTLLQGGFFIHCNF